MDQHLRSAISNESNGIHNFLIAKSKENMKSISTHFGCMYFFILCFSIDCQFAVFLGMLEALTALDGMGECKCDTDVKAMVFQCRGD